MNDIPDAYSKFIPYLKGYVYTFMFLFYTGVIERSNSEEGAVVNLALDFIENSRLLPNVLLKAYSRSLEVSSSGLDYILAGTNLCFFFYDTDIM